MRNTQLNSNGVGVNRVPPDGKGIAQHTPTRTLADYAGREAMIAGFGEQVMGFKNPEILAVFNYFVNPKQVKTTASSGDYTITTDASRLKMTAGAGAGVGEAIAESVRNIIYRPGYDSYCTLTAAFDEDLPGTTQDFGPHDDLNGYSISLSNGNLAVKHFSGEVLVSTTESPNFELDSLDGGGLSGFTVNPQALNLYRIAYGYLGLFPASFEVYGGANIGWVPFHYIDVTGLDNNLIIQDPYLPIRFTITSDGTNEVSMYSGSWNAGVISGPIPKHLSDSYSEFNDLVAFNGGGIIKPIFSIRNETTFKTKVNKIAADLDIFTASVDGNKLHDICLILNPTTLTGPVWNSVDSSSIMSVDKVATAITGGEMIRIYDLGKVADLGVGARFEVGEIRLLPGDILTVAVDTASNPTDIGASLHWEELK